jgi:hypothetical protein
LDRAYEVLGVKPGVSDRELKAAHRDLAKVWHPDRFVHDPRLQEKAQEKLKEINEAYEQLISRHKRRVTPPPPRTSRHAQAADTARVTVKRGVGWHWWIAVPFAVFALVFALTVNTLVREPQPPPAESAQLQESIDQAPTTTTRPDASHTVRNRDNDLAPAPEAPAEPAPSNEAVAPVPTVTVSIDPESGLLATPACPVKSRMTYPSGSEPHGYCNINHVVKPEKKTGLKGLAKRISEID